MGTLTSRAVKQKAREIGFDLCGIAPAVDLPELSFFQEWLSRGFAGAMSYLERSARRRADVRRVLPSAKTVIATGTNYNTDRPYSVERSDPGRALIARYAWGDDYHRVILERLHALVEWMHETAGEPFDAKVYVDTGPVQERVYARHAGIGWIGKNTCVINSSLGSWLFLGEIICSLPLDVDEPAFDQCGECRLCIEACPTSALVGPGVLDATKCISYLTIESRDEVPESLRNDVGAHVYGCDVCQDVCPWNANAPASGDPAWQPRAVWDGVETSTLAAMSDDALENALRDSAMSRARVSGLRRNLQIGMRYGEAKLYHRGGGS
jgi:epoxyqueuosine reductase